jgi:hypothetical protein
MLANVLRDIELANVMKSSTDSVDPSRAFAYIDRELPKRPKLLSDIEEPMWTKSNTDKVEPNRHIPYKAMLEPIRP